MRGAGSTGTTSRTAISMAGCTAPGRGRSHRAGQRQRRAAWIDRQMLIALVILRSFNGSWRFCTWVVLALLPVANLSLCKDALTWGPRSILASAFNWGPCGLDRPYPGKAVGAPAVVLYCRWYRVDAFLIDTIYAIKTRKRRRADRCENPPPACSVTKHLCPMAAPVF